jgi:hypothetical protein
MSNDNTSATADNNTAKTNTDAVKAAPAASTAQETGAANQEAKVTTESADKVETKAAGNEQGKTEAAKETVEVKYELKLPEKSRFDDAYLKKFTEEVKSKGLKPEDAQKQLDERHGFVNEFMAEKEAAYERQKEGWLETIKTDKKYGGQQLEETAGFAKRGMEAFGSEGLRKILEETGWKYHPEVVKLFADLGRQASDDKLVRGGQVEKKEELPLRERLAKKLYGPGTAVTNEVRTNQ